MDNKKELYLIYDRDDESYQPVKLSKAQANAIEWFILRFDLEYLVESTNECACEEVD